MRATNIIWDLDEEDEGVSIPSEIEIPDGMTNEDDISNYLSELNGYCHEGYVLDSNAA